MTRVIPTLLIVDDEKNTREGLQKALKYDYQVTLAEHAESALEILKTKTFDLILSDVKMPGMDGVSFIKVVRDEHPEITSVVMTAFGSIDTAVDAMKNGAYDFLTKPLDLENLDKVLSGALASNIRQKEVLEAVIEEVEEDQPVKKKAVGKVSRTSIIGESEAFKKVLGMVEQIAPARSTVLLTGENGTGKEVIAKAIHEASDRVKNPFVAIHCAALNANLLESELFGHEKGAFTGANAAREGRFEAADGGTLFLDEIGEIDQATQVKLLRVLESRSFERVGGTRTINVDVRLVAATNRNLKEMVQNGTFREDLYYRLNVINIDLPSLRKRVEDIPLLLNYYLSIYNKENAKQIAGFTDAALATLKSYSWPGNIRELRNVVERMVVLCNSELLGEDLLPNELKNGALIVEESTDVKKVTTFSSLDVKKNEKDLIIKALEECGGNKTAAAQKLGISRRTLHRKIESLGLK